MLNFILRRVLYAIPILFGVSLITFILFHLAGGDPILQMLGKHASEEEIFRLRHEYGFDLPLYKQFLHYLYQTFTLQFERSFETKQTIGTLLKNGAGVSLMLTLPAFFMTTVLSVALAFLCALYRNLWIDRTLVFLSILGMSISALAFILFGQYFLAFKFGEWVSAFGYDALPVSGFEPGLSGIRYLILPWIIWIMVGLGPDVRFFRTVFLEELSQDYVRTAYAKGASTLRVMVHHVLPNAMLPIITRLVINIPFLFLGSLLLENFFGIPGLGNISVNAFNFADWPVIKAMTFLGSVLYIFGNILSDVLYACFDPRVRFE